jgi:hypothetical protein
VTVLPLVVQVGAVTPLAVAERTCRPGGTESVMVSMVELGMSQRPERFVQKAVMVKVSGWPMVAGVGLTVLSRQLIRVEPKHVGAASALGASTSSPANIAPNTRL